MKRPLRRAGLNTHECMTFAREKEVRKEPTRELEEAIKWHGPHPTREEGEEYEDGSKYTITNLGRLVSTLTARGLPMRTRFLSFGSVCSFLMMLRRSVRLFRPRSRDKSSGLEHINLINRALWDVQNKCYVFIKY